RCQGEIDGGPDNGTLIQIPGTIRLGGAGHPPTANPHRRRLGRPSRYLAANLAPRLRPLAPRTAPRSVALLFRRLDSRPWPPLRVPLGPPLPGAMTPPNRPAGNSAASRDIAHVLHPYTDLVAHERDGPLIVTGGRGVRVFDEDGRDYIEAMAGLWCTALGFDEPRLVRAAAEAMERLPFYHLFGGKSHTPGIDLAERLIGLAPAPMSKVFFANSGSEANDSAIKLAWYYNNARGRPAKKKIISRRRAYHGVTIATASLTGLPANQRDFDLPIDGILHTDCPHHWRHAEPGESEEQFATRLAESLDRLIEDEGPNTVAAFIAEPVMGAGGVIVPPRTYFEKIQR